MKELRPPGTNIRILFAFDPRRVAILLIGGNKTNRWQKWYDENISIADELYDEYLEELHREGELPLVDISPGTKSAQSCGRIQSIVTGSSRVSRQLRLA